jgi:CO/xanthine dehydrogenase Mo-binding subunit
MSGVSVSESSNPLERLSLSRRWLLQASGALIVSAGPLSLLRTSEAQAAEAGFSAAKPALSPDQLDTWLAVSPDGSVTVFFGKIDNGQGTDVAIMQVVAEELDVPLDKVAIIMGDTASSVNLGGASNSSGIKLGAHQVRLAAAEARRVLVEAAAKKLGTDHLIVENGVVIAANDPARRVSYAELIGGRYFNQPLEWNHKIGNALEIKGKATPKKVADYRIVGKPAPRADVTGKVYGITDYVTDVRVPDMLHARTIHPPMAGGVPASVDEASIKGTNARVVRVKDYVAVVAEREWDAVRAAQMLKVNWKGPKNPFPDQKDFYDHIRNAPPTKEKTDVNVGDVDAAFKTAAKTISAEYEWPFQSHASMGPACAVVSIKDGNATIFTGSQKPHYVGGGVAAVTGLDPKNIHAIWVPGPGNYGRNDADDTVAEAAVVSQATGRPVRLQNMRSDSTGWDPKAPAGVHAVRAAFDKDGNVIAYDLVAKAFSTLDVDAHAGKAADLWIGQVFGATTEKRVYAFNTPAESYKFANKRMKWQTVAPLLDRNSPLRSSHMRDTSGPQLHFASESFTDEMAYAAGIDPLAFRMKYLSKDRDKAALQAAIDKAGWTPHIAPQRIKGSGGTLIGRGIGYAERGGTVVAIVAEIEVDPATGRIWPRKMTVAHDCGMIVNPATLRMVIEGNIVQSSSRSLCEEVTFDRNSVSSVDWATYPILEMPDAPETIDVILIDRPDVASSGAGEPSTRPVAGAIANALFDATGVRLRRAPFTPERVKEALSRSAGLDSSRHA